MKAEDSILKVQELRTWFPIERGIFIKHQEAIVKAVDGVSFELKRGEVLGLVGESGCGKSTLGRTILQLIRPTSGVVVLGGKNLTELDGEELRHARADFQMVFQDPYASLNPRITVYDTLAEAVRAHAKVSSSELEKRIRELMSKVGLPVQHLKRYPHQFSGGQRQRIAIARALAVNPKVIIADEPVSALDVSIQAQIINLLADLQREMHLSMIFISHDLSVVKHISDRIAVMYLGRIVELGPAESVIERPLHPYSMALISAIPHTPGRQRQERVILSGEPPSPLNPPPGCPFHTRCPYCIERCKEVVPPFFSLGGPQEAACIRLKEIHSGQ